jgi:hypothetical protein
MARQRQGLTAAPVTRVAISGSTSRASRPWAPEIFSRGVDPEKRKWTPGDMRAEGTLRWTALLWNG